jgi:hypothetical protein
MMPAVSGVSAGIGASAVMGCADEQDTKVASPQPIVE